MSFQDVVVVKGDNVRIVSSARDLVRANWDGWHIQENQKVALSEDIAGALQTDIAVPFDPAEHDVAAVQKHLETADDAERTRVLDAERGGKARKSLLGE